MNFAVESMAPFATGDRVNLVTRDPLPRRRRQFTPVPTPELPGIDRRVKRAREKAGYSTRELAALAGVSQYTIVTLEGGTPYNTTVTTLCRIADALRVPREWLIFGSIAVQSSDEEPPST